MKANKEALIQEIIELSQAIPGLFLWKAGAGRVATSQGNLMRSGPKGAAPITGLMSGGKRIEVEISEGLPPSPHQHSFRLSIEKLGGIYLFCSTIEEASKALCSISQNGTSGSEDKGLS